VVFVLAFAWHAVRAEHAGSKSGSTIDLAPRDHCQIGNGPMVRCISTFHRPTHVDLRAGGWGCAGGFPFGAQFVSSVLLTVTSLQHEVQFKPKMVIGPYDKRLKRSRCLNCIARHNKARNAWPADKNRLRSDNCTVFGRHAMLVLSKILTRLSVCEWD
jgi:hypothetical protein